jgi:O-methyltransferase
VAEQCVKDVPGSVAELGVCAGHFARLINHSFHDRKLFLYDTFEGFDDRDVDHDTVKGFLGMEEDLHGFLKVGEAETIINFIKEVCPHPENLVFRKGYFPETAVPDEGETFAFISLDVDLYKPTYAGLEFFYPRLQEGGVIFVHDYNSGWGEAICSRCGKNLRTFQESSST